MKSVRPNRCVMPTLAVVALLGAVWVAKGLGVWQTSGRGQILLDANGNPDPQGIEGWMTLSDVSETYSVPLSALYAMIGAWESISADTVLKDLESLQPAIGVGGVRAGVAASGRGTWSPDDGPFGLQGSHDSAVPPSSGSQVGPEPRSDQPVEQGTGEGGGLRFELSA